MTLFFIPWVGIYLCVLCAILGVVMGSAMNCFAYRYVHKEKWSGGRSHCAECGHELKTRDLIPVVSYLSLKGRCRYCKKKISPRYVAAEIGMAVLYLGILLRFDLEVETIFNLILVTCLFTLSLIDLDIQIIPDRFLIIAAASRILFLVGENGFDLPVLWYSLWHGLALGGSVLILSLIMDKVLGKESMGGGDIKLLFVLGLYFDLPCCFFLMITACILGIVIAMWLGAKKDMAFPFGPALSLAAWVTLLFGGPVTSWYLSLFH